MAGSGRKPLLEATGDDGEEKYPENRLIELMNYPQKHFNFFVNKLFLLAAKAAYHILCANPESVLALVEEDPSILHCKIEEIDPCGRRVSGKLLQIAVMTGNFNLPKKNGEEKNPGQGLVEQLCGYLPKEEAGRQLMAVLPNDWENDITERMRTYVSALNEFVESLIQAKAASIQGLEAECKPGLDKLLIALNPKRCRVIERGLIFNPQIFSTAIKLYNVNVDRLGGMSSIKSAFFWVRVFGSLQAKASACDLQIFNKGINKVILDGEAVDTSFHFSDGWPQSLSELGDSFYLDQGGMRRDVETHGLGLAQQASLFQDLCQAKSTAIRELKQHLELTSNCYSCCHS